MDQSPKHLNPFKVDWQDKPVASTPALAPTYGVLTAWNELTALTQQEFSELPAMSQLVAFLQDQMPVQWVWSETHLVQFLTRLDQLEDLAWAIELKRGMG